MMKSYVVYGSGGHAKVIVDLIRDIGGELKCIFDDYEYQDGLFMNIPVKAYDPFLYSDSLIVIAIGNNKFREKMSFDIKHDLTTLIHPKASVSKLATIGDGTVVLANAIVQADAVIGKHVIINAGACIDHDVTIKDFVHVSPLVYIGGNAVIEMGVTVGSGSIVMRNVLIEENEFVSELTLVHN